jgi:hypothetical protein
MCGVGLHGGLWDDKEVGVRDPIAPFVQVNGPRAGNHRVWITHLYERRGGLYEFVATKTVRITACTTGRLPAATPGRQSMYNGTRAMSN